VIHFKKKVNYCILYSFGHFYLSIIIMMMIIMMMVRVLSFQLKVLSFIGKHSIVGAMTPLIFAFFLGLSTL
jgi:hypothetical protein